MHNKVLSMIGLAMKAGQVKSGEFAAEKAIKSRRARLVIIASDSSDNTIKKFTDICSFRDIPIIIYGTKEELGQALGKEYRAVLAIIDDNLSRSILDKID